LSESAYVEKIITKNPMIVIPAKAGIQKDWMPDRVRHDRNGVMILK
jgi:hypothetical protein